jgi:hypothetical protein
MLRRRIIVRMGLVALVVCIMIGNSFLIVRYVPPLFGMYTVSYQGQEIRLSKRYSNFGEYKRDPDNIDSSELERVEKLVRGAKIAPAFSNRAEMEHAISEVTFPGYHMTPFPAKTQPHGAALEMFAIEIPKCDKERYFVFRHNSDAYELVDDFVAAAVIAAVREEDGQLTYRDDEGRIVRKKQ